MSKLSVMTIDGVTFAENYNSDTGESIYVAHRPFMYGNRNVDTLDSDAFWRWVVFQSKIAGAESSGLNVSEIDRTEWLDEAMDASVTAADILMSDSYNVAAILS